MPLSSEDRAELIRLAKQAVAAEVMGAPSPRVENLQGVLAEKRGCFVTLTRDGHLRGCIGMFEPDTPLGETIVEMGRAAARDPRFIHRDPITPRELSRLTVEVSVLSRLEPTLEPEKLRVGVHGIYIVRGARAGCFLPEVATDMGWSTAEFLSECCQGKAGLPADAWRQPGTQVFLFTSEKFEH